MVIVETYSVTSFFILYDFRSTSNKETVPALPAFFVQMILHRWYIHNCFFPHFFSVLSSAHSKTEFWKIIKWFPTVGHKKCSSTSFFLFVFFCTSFVNVNKFDVFCGFGHIYWRNPLWKTSFFTQWKLLWMNWFKPAQSLRFNSIFL